MNTSNAHITGDQVDIPHSENAQLNCPICFKPFTTLAKLNEHLDQDHGFQNEIESQNKTTEHIETSERGKTSKRNPRNANNHNNKLESSGKLISNRHWKKFTPGSKCNDCKRQLKKSSEVRNCRKCGNIYCKRHCANVIRLNMKAEYDPKNGTWYSCCHSCYELRPGYNDFGGRVDLTHTFSNTRNKMNDDKELRKLQIENRLVRIIDGIIKLYIAAGDGVMAIMTLDYQISNLEKSITPWKDDTTALNCNICHTNFTILQRRHHCRLCGSVVCDNKNTDCSNEILVRFLRRITADLPYSEKVPTSSEFDKSIRICSSCFDMVYTSRKFIVDVQSEPSALILKYYNLRSLSEVIDSILPRFEELLSNMEIAKELNKPPNAIEISEMSKFRERLLRSFTSYNILAKQLLAITPANISEKRIQASIQTVSSNYIAEKILPMKNIPTILGNSTSSNESSTTTSLADSEHSKIEVKKLSDLMNNLNVKEIKEYREELMVYKEQSFMLQSMIEKSKRQRNFDEVQILSQNLQDITTRIHDIQGKLGEQGFE